MRNLEQYPVTAREILDTLGDNVMRVKSSDAPGGTEAMIMDAILDYFTDNPRALATIAETLRA